MTENRGWPRYDPCLDATYIMIIQLQPYQISDDPMLSLMSDMKFDNRLQRNCFPHLYNYTPCQSLPYCWYGRFYQCHRNVVFDTGTIVTNIFENKLNTNNFHLKIKLTQIWNKVSNCKRKDILCRVLAQGPSLDVRILQCLHRHITLNKKCQDYVSIKWEYWRTM